ncbi:MAG: DsrE/DsrF/DrsH-like family protein [Alicyclobacillus sp.]|nr:DsrE/DsrF/DrsH-like family protein [Alicyclobacillus sp.]
MAEAKRRVAIIASQGGLDAAYKVLNIATAAAATDAEVAIFFTFEGLSIIRKDAESTLTMGPGKEHWMEGFKRANVPTIAELLDVARESGVKLIACQMTMDVMGMTVDDFINGVEVGGAVTFLDFAYDADVTVTF